MTNDYKYDSIGNFINGIAIIRRKNLYGAILSGGRELIAPNYDYMSNFKNGYSRAIKEGITIIIDLSGREYIETSHGLFEIPKDVVCIEECGKNLYRFAKMVDVSPYTTELKWGVMNEKYEILIKPEFDYIHDYVLNTTKACKITNQNDAVEWFIITNKSMIGQETFEIEPAILGEDEFILTRVCPDYSENYFTNRIDKYFCIRTNSSGTAILYCNGRRYTLDKDVYRVFPLNYGHYIVQNKLGKFGAVDRWGVSVTPISYNSKYSVLYSHIIMLPNGKEISLPKDITKIFSFEGEYAKFISVKDPMGFIEEMGLIDCRGNIVAKDMPFFIASYNIELNGFLLQRSKNNKDWIGLLDVKEGRIIKPNYNRICVYNSEGAKVEIKDVGIFNIDKLGQCVISNNGKRIALPVLFSAGFPPTNDISIVIKNDLFGLYNVELNNLIIDCKYQQIKFHKVGVYIAKSISYIEQPKKWGEEQPDIEEIRYDVFDKTGTMILSNLESVAPISENRFIVSKGELYGLLNDHKENLVQFENISIKDLGYNRVAAINKDKELRILNYEGEPITERFVSLHSDVEVYPYEMNIIAKVQWLNYIGYIDLNGNLVMPYEKKFVTVPSEYDWCFDFNGKLFRCLKYYSDYELFNNNFIKEFEIGCIVKSDKTELIYKNNKLTKVLTDVQVVCYTCATFSIIGVSCPENESELYNYGIIDRTGKWYIDPMPYLEFDCLSNSIIIIHGFSSKKALLNPKKGLVSDFKYTKVELSKDKKTIIATVVDEEFSKSKRWDEKDRFSIDLLDENFKVMASIEDSHVSSQIIVEDQCLLIIEKNSTHEQGVINNKGEIIIPIRYPYLHQFDSKSFEVGISYECRGIIDFNGKIIVPIQYASIIKNSADSYIGIEKPQTPDGYNLLF